MRIFLLSILLFFVPLIQLANCETICVLGNVNLESVGFEKDDSQFIHAWVTREEVPAYRCFDSSEVNKRLSMRSKYRIVAGNYRKKHNNKYWSLLVGGSEGSLDTQQIVGWVSHDALIFDKRPLLNYKTNIHEKVLIREGDSDGGRSLHIYANPERLDRNGREGIEVRTVFYVYDYYPHSAGDPSSNRTQSLLISPLPMLDVHSDCGAPLLVGWVDRSKVTFWNSRTACEFSVGSSIQLMDDNRTPVFTVDTIDRPLSYKSLRNPILSSESDCYRIGAFSRLSIEDEKIRDGLSEIQTGLEVLFVIDGTRSMTVAFKGTVRGVKRVVNSLQAKSKAAGLEQPRFGLFFYRDKANQSPVRKDANGQIRSAENIPFCKQEITAYRMGSSKALIANLDKHTACDSDDSPAESVYKGLVEAVRRVGFLTGADGEPTRLRVIVHIGDAGDNRSGNYSDRNVASILKEHSIYQYVGIDVSTFAITPSFGKAIRPLVKEARRLKIKAKYISRPSDLAQSVSLTLGNFEREQEKLKDQINIISRGFAGTSEGRVGVVSPEILEYAKRVIRANNIDLSAYGAFQQYVEGNISKSADLLKYVLVSKTDIEKITSFLTRLIETANIENRKAAWDGLLEIILGDESCTRVDGTEMTIGECNKMRNGIPIQAGFMKYTKKQFLNLDGRTLAEVICDANVTRERLRMLIQNKKVRAVRYTNRRDCDFQLDITSDLNDDGFVVRDKQVSVEKESGDLEYVRKATDNDLVDKYFFKEGGESVAWILLDHLGTLDER